MDNYELTHHGIKGMRWGVRRTPAQLGHKPSSGDKSKTGGFFKSLYNPKKIEERNKAKQQKAAEKEKIKKEKTQEEIEETKQKILKTKSPRLLYENADLFTTQELQTAYSRMTLERNIAGLIPKQVNEGEKFIDNTIKWTRKATDLLTAGTAAYKSIDTIRKMFNGDSTSSNITKYKNKDVSKMTDDALAKALKRATSEKALKRILDESK